VSLTQVSTGDLKRLRGRLADRSTDTPLTRLALDAAALGRCADVLLKAFGRMGRKPAIALLDAVLAERARPRSRIDLLWTGPEAPTSIIGSNRAALATAFELARSEVLIAGYSFDHGRTLLAPLHRAMVDRDVAVDVYLNLKVDAHEVGPDDEMPMTKAVVAGFLKKNWPTVPPRPRFFYDRRPFISRVRSSMHAKCVVVDRRLSIVTSANFTDRGQTRNVEVGVEIEDPHFAEHLIRQFRAATAQGHFAEVSEESGSTST